MHMTSNVRKVQLYLKLRKYNFQTRIKKIEKPNVHMEIRNGYIYNW